MGSQLSYPSVDLSGRVAVVTGGNAGIGYETAKALAAMGAHTIIACRSRDRAEQVQEALWLASNLGSGTLNVAYEYFYTDKTLQAEAETACQKWGGLGVHEVGGGIII